MKEKITVLPKFSIAGSIEVLRRRHPGALVCLTCARLIASTPAGYATSNLTPEEVETYICAECRYDADPARSKGITDRIAASKATAAAARLRPPLAHVLAGRTLERLPDDALIVRTAEADCGRRVAHDYLDTCVTTGHHRDLDTLADCPHPSATVTQLRPSPEFCAHGRPMESCITHAPKTVTPFTGPQNCAACGGYHVPTVRDGKPIVACPYTTSEAACVKVFRTPERARSRVLHHVRHSRSLNAHQQSSPEMPGGRTSRLTGRPIRPRRKDCRSDASRAALERINAARRRRQIIGEASVAVDAG
jgi:hypothetical protein